MGESSESPESGIARGVVVEDWVGVCRNLDCGAQSSQQVCGFAAIRALKSWTQYEVTFT